MPRKVQRVDADGKQQKIARLKRIEGQIRGLINMVDEDRYCVDILTQISSVQQALRAVGRELLRDHLKHCATDAIRQGGGAAETACDELIDLMYKNLR
jgi:CsoR family transcriptional regulator, copper-sensing transcriptional repressor